MNSHLLEGKVRHRRAQPISYALEHDVFYLALDLAELDAVTSRSRLLGRNGRHIASFRDADHLPRPATDLALDLPAHLGAEGIDPTGWQVTLVTNPRVLGYVFNPASFFLCRDVAGVLQVVVVEVHNTHGERHLYTLQRHPDRQGSSFSASMDKAFYVSPFIEMAGRYTVHVRETDDGLRIAINERADDRPVLSTSLVLRRHALTDATLARMLLRHPLLPHRTIAFIHLHALRIWLRGVRFIRHHEAVT